MRWGWVKQCCGEAGVGAARPDRSGAGVRVAGRSLLFDYSRYRKPRGAGAGGRALWVALGTRGCEAVGMGTHGTPGTRQEAAQEQVVKRLKTCRFRVPRAERLAD